MIKNSNIAIRDLEKVFSFIESSWYDYLKKHYKGKVFVFYVWGDYQIPAIRISIASFYKELELPFVCSLNKVNSLNELLVQYREKAQFNGIAIIEVDETDNNMDNNDEIESHYKLTVYSKIIKC
ncbi:hypothetical protein [Paenibacillus puerhi]|uniref:hypothetical protein n=1 Tax=Paenibacillus puerhi TaxID=2692622 RepID=UPI001F1634C5|nr:hypothetical protein [Paenibacillus puerhi]